MTPFQVFGDPAFLESKEELFGSTLDPIEIADGGDLVMTGDVGQVLAGQGQTLLVPNGQIPRDHKKDFVGQTEETAIVLSNSTRRSLAVALRGRSL